MTHLNDVKTEPENGSRVTPPFEDRLMVILRWCGVQGIIIFLVLERVSNFGTAGVGKTTLAYLDNVL
jgi:hypothetical protein